MGQLSIYKAIALYVEQVLCMFLNRRIQWDRINITHPRIIEADYIDFLSSLSPVSVDVRETLLTEYSR